MSEEAGLLGRGVNVGGVSPRRLLMKPARERMKEWEEWSLEGTGV